MQRFFGYTGALKTQTADEVWKLANAKLASDGFTVRGLISQRSNVELICTTDDPCGQPAVA